MSFTMSGAAVPVVMTFFGCLSFTAALYLLWMLFRRSGDDDESGDNEGDDEEDGKYKKM